MALVASRLEIRRANEGFPLGTPYSDLCAAGPVVPILASTQMRRDQGLAGWDPGTMRSSPTATGTNCETASARPVWREGSTRPDGWSGQDTGEPFFLRSGPTSNGLCCNRGALTLSIHSKR
jgi:hypothetical protein